MFIEQKSYSKDAGWKIHRESGLQLHDSYDLVLVFGTRNLITDAAIFEYIKKSYPGANILLNSTAGEILDTEISDNSISLTAIKLEKATIKTAVIDIKNVEDSYQAAKILGDSLPKDELRSVLVISDGHQVNGSELVAGLSESLPKDVILTGGLAGDGDDFNVTVVGLNQIPSEGKIVVVGFYGNSLIVNYGSIGGWDPFGPGRLITKSKNNILYELDNKPALEVYKKYLGEYAKELPGAALRFPLNIRMNGDKHTVVRTILSVNETENSLTFAGNMPIGAYAQLMKANYDRLIEGASTAASNSITGTKSSPELALLISCVGRKLVLGQRIEEEVDAVRNIYGDTTVISGFYSYGEIAPSFQFMKCELHNQTMTITTFSEE